MRKRTLSVNKFILSCGGANLIYFVFCGLFIMLSFISEDGLFGALPFLFFVLSVLSFQVCALETCAYDEGYVSFFGKKRWIFWIYRIVYFLVLVLFIRLTSSEIIAGISISLLVLIFFVIYAVLYYAVFKKRSAEILKITLYKPPEFERELTFKVRTKFTSAAFFSLGAIASFIWFVIEIATLGDYIFIGLELFIMFSALTASSFYTGLTIYKLHNEAKKSKQVMRSVKRR